jgi:hypothetical protein
VSLVAICNQITEPGRVRKELIKNKNKNVYFPSPTIHTSISTENEHKLTKVSPPAGAIQYRSKGLEPRRVADIFLLNWQCSNVIIEEASHSPPPTHTPCVQYSSTVLTILTEQKLKQEWQNSPAWTSQTESKNLVWFGEIERKLAKLSKTTFAYRSSS